MYRLKHLLALLVLAFISSTSFAQQDSVWTEELRLKQLRNIPDSTLWDMERLQEDNAPSAYGQTLPITDGAFPVPVYENLGKGSFRGVASMGNAYGPVEINGKQVVYSSFIVGNTLYYKSDNGPNRAFFTLITLTDSVDTLNYSTARSQVSSRNHPDYVAQGYFIGKKHRVDYIAFTTPEGEDYALVNMRLFHLKYGNFILIAPQPDGTFRSMQLKEKDLSANDVDKHVKTNVLKREEVIDFLTK